MCGVACAPSMSVVTPRRFASAIISPAGLMVPSEFETWGIASNFVRGVNSEESPLRSSVPSGVTST
jgi:hypothetical protein